MHAKWFFTLHKIEEFTSMYQWPIRLGKKKWKKRAFFEIQENKIAKRHSSHMIFLIISYQRFGQLFLLVYFRCWFLNFFYFFCKITQNRLWLKITLKWFFYYFFYLGRVFLLTVSKTPAGSLIFISILKKWKFSQNLIKKSRAK